MTRAIILIGLALLPIARAGANSAPVAYEGISGTDLVITKSEAIRLIKETVDIDCDWKQHKVEATFWLENVTSQPQRLRLGFPFEYSSWYEDEELVTHALQDLKISWKGQPVKVELSPLETSEGADRPVYLQWASWVADFAPGEMLTHRVEYSLPMWWYEPGSKAAIHTYSYLKYILRTGSQWTGPIGASIVTVHFAHPLPDELISYYALSGDKVPPALLHAYPPGFLVDTERQTLRWEFKDLVPKQDLYFGTGAVPDFQALDEAGQLPGM